MVEVPLERAPSGHVLIEAVVEVRTGERVRLPFLLDTGASGSIVSRSALPSTTLTAVEPVTSGVIHSAAGQVTGDRDILRARLNLEAWTSREIELTVLPLEGLATALGVPLGGIIGLDILALGELWLDLGNGRLMMSAGKSRLADIASDLKSFASAPFRLVADTLIAVEVRLRDVGATAILDLGAAVTVVNQAAADRTLGSDEDGGATGTRGTAALGAEGPGVAASPHTFEHIRLGTIEVTQFPVYIAELPVFETLGLHETPAMLLGLDFMTDRIVGIDFAAEQIYLSRHPRRKGSDAA
jgi:predicted aspartyl protease